MPREQPCYVPHVYEVLSGLQVLMLNDNDIKGDLSDAGVLKNLASLKKLQILEMGNLPGTPCLPRSLQQ